MENCSWGALALFIVIVLLMIWVHAQMISPWLISHFREQQSNELQERLILQQQAAETLQAQQQQQHQQQQQKQRAALVAQSHKLKIKQTTHTKKVAAVSKPPKAKAIKQNVSKATQAMKGSNQKNVATKKKK